MSTPKGIVLVDDHPLYREGLRARLAVRQDLCVLAEASSKAEALRVLKGMHPHVAVIDISLPDGSGIDLIRAMRQLCPDLRVLMLSMHTKIDFIVAAFQAGANGYMSKDATGDEIVRAVDVLLHGGQYLDATLAPAVVRRLKDVSGRKAQAMDASYGNLTLREQQVMRLLAEGLSPEEIATKLFVSRKTVLIHRYAIMNKLGIKSPLAFVRYAARLGLVDLDEGPEFEGMDP